MLYWSTMASCPVPAIHILIIVLLAAIFIHVPAAAVIVVPNSNCYTFDNESRLVDFTHLAGKGFEYNEEGLQRHDLFVQFCKDVQRRSGGGFIKFGNFVGYHSFLTGTEHIDYIQVYEGLTQLGFEKLHHGFSFQTEQIHVSLYLSALSSLSGLVGKPTFKVNPVKGLGVTLTGSAVDSALPTTLSPTVLNLVWRCEIARSSPYEVNILIPVEGYDPVEFTLSKKCGSCS